MASLSIHPFTKAALVPLQRQASQLLPSKIPLLPKNAFDKQVAPKAPKPTTPIGSLKPSSREIFWGLGEEWWKQLIDARYHGYGPYVFDKGLHGGDVEPGFYRNAKEACKFASLYMTLNPTVYLYQRLHRAACQHFAGKRNSTLMSSSQTGMFISPIDKGVKCRSISSTLFRAIPDRYKEIRREYAKHERNLELGNILFWERNFARKKAVLDKEGLSFRAATHNYNLAKTWLNSYYELVISKLDNLNSYIALKSQNLGLTHPIASLDREGPDNILVTYKCTKEEVDYVVRTLFNEYESKMSSASSKEEKLRCIAELFQMLEWLHPFNDGQGRTDLILLAKELCRHGFNPAILEDPFVSTFSTLDDWVAYLKKGMKKWRQQQAALHSPLKPLD